MTILRMVGMMVTVTVLLQANKLAALPASGVTSLESPNRHYKVTLTDNSERSSSYSSSYCLTISESNRVMARYPFDGEMVNGYWSPSEQYLAIDNHDGHRGWIVLDCFPWKDGAVLTAHGRVPPSDYNPYLKDEALPDIYSHAESVLRSLCPGVNDFDGPNWPISVAYGWKSDKELLMFHELTSDQLVSMRMLWFGSPVHSNSRLQALRLKPSKVKK